MIPNQPSHLFNHIQNDKFNEHLASRGFLWQCGPTFEQTVHKGGGFLICLTLTAPAQTGDPLWSIGTQTVSFPQMPGGTVVQNALPESHDPAIPDQYEYQGAIPQYAQNVQFDQNGDLQFFIIDGQIYDSNGLMLADADVGSCQVCLWHGATRVAVIPVPGSCTQYYIVAGIDRTDRLDLLHAFICFGVLDLQLPNDFPFYTQNNLPVTGRFIYYNDPDFYTLIAPAQTPMGLDDIVGNAGNNYLQEYELPNSYTGAYDLVVFDMVQLSPNGNTLMAVHSEAAINFLNFTGQGPQFVASFQPGNYGLFGSSEVSMKREIDMKLQGGTLQVAYTREAGQATGNGLLVHRIPEIAVWDFSISGTANPAPVVSHLNVANNPRKYVVDDYIETPSNAPVDHMGTRVWTPRVSGLEFSPNGQYLYFVKSSYSSFLPATIGYLQPSVFPGGVTALNIGPLSAMQELIDTEIETNIGPNGVGSALYMVRANSLGQYHLAALTDPNNPDPQNWIPSVAQLPNAAVRSGIGNNSYRVLNSRVDGGTQLDALQGGSCCLANFLLNAEPTYYTWNGSNNWSTSLSPGSNPFVGAPAEVFLDQDFVVLSNTTLYVEDMTWRFAPGKRLLIESGARVFFRNSVLSSTNCENDRWRGVEVRGVSTDAVNANTQGRITLTNCTVENAQIGVLCSHFNGQSYVWSGNGGAVRASNTIFKNNNTGVLLYPFQPNSTLQSLCKFENCSFQTDQDWPDPGLTLPRAQLTLLGVNDILVRNCSFRNLAPTLFPVNVRGRGIQAVQSGFRVLGNHNPNGDRFENLTVGIMAAVASPLQNYSVRGMHFQNNWYGILDQSTLNPQIYENNFSMLLDAYSQPSVGLYLFQTEGYSVEQNMFEGSFLGGPHSYGIYFYGPTYQDNRIYNNTFEQLYVGNAVEWPHVGNILPPNNIPIGLQLLCGDYLNNTFDQAILASGVIRQDQGQTDFPPRSLANNRFLSNPDCQNTWEPWVDPNPMPNFQVQYFYYDNTGDPEMKPECVVGSHVDDVYDIVGFAFNDPFDKTSFCSDGDLLQSSPHGQLVAHYSESIASLGSAVNTYNSVVDGGEPGDLIGAILEQNPIHPSYYLRDLLLSGFPLSDEVMQHALFRETPMDSWHLTQILIDNSPLDPGFHQEVIDSEVLNSFFLGLLALAQGNDITLRRVLEMEISAKHALKDRYRHRLLAAWASDTSMVNSSDSVVTWLQADSLSTGPRDLYRLYLHEGEYAAANALQATLANDPENDGVLELGRIQQGLNGNWLDAQTSDINDLWDLAFATEATAKGDAWAILHLLGATDSLPTVLEPGGNRSAVTYRDPINSSIPMIDFGVYPNPTSGSAWFTLPKDFAGGILEIFDTQGRLVRSERVQGVLAEVDLQHVEQGMYVARLVFEGFSVAELKFTVAK